MLRTLRSQFLVLGIAITWAVGGTVAFLGYWQLVGAVRREANARIEDALRVGQRLIDEEFVRIDPLSSLPKGVNLLVLPAQDFSQSRALRTLILQATEKGEAHGFALLEEGLSMVAAKPSPDRDRILISILPLRWANWLVDEIRNIVFGYPEKGSQPETVTFFERDLRIATNVITADGRRAVGTRASKQVARRVLVQGKPWKDRAFVVDRWMITNYLPITSLDDDVIGMLYAGLDEGPYVAEGKRSEAIFLASIFVLTVLLTGAAWYMSGRLSRPLAELAGAVDAFGKGKNEKIRVGSRASHEIRLLAQSFNTMTDLITSRDAALMASGEKAQKALNDYLEVLGFVAHELKSPIAGALTQLMVIESGYVGNIPEQIAPLLEGIHRSLAYGHEMALSFNQLSRSESEGFAARRQSIADFNKEIIHQAISDASTEAARYKISITVNGEPVSVQADPELMRVVMDNLIGNAVKYGLEGTEILVISKKAGENLRVEVYNRGVGVPKDRLSELFSKFLRIQDPKLGSRRGTGVGLYLVKKFVEIHGGRVGVEGEYEKWIRFWFEIPANQPAST
jgi:signal transduction histidine kinase